MKKFTFALLLSGASFAAKAQGDTVIFTQLGHYYYDTTVSWSAYTPLIDRLGRSYVYTASIDLGMVTFDINNLMNPVPIDTVHPNQIGNWKATSLAQEADTLYISTGGFQFAGQRAGLAIYDVTNPANPVQLDRWDTAAWTHGTAHVVVKNNYAYLAAMDDGIIILDVSQKNNIRFVSHLTLTNLPNTGYAPHARGLYLSGDTLLVADDGGGIRIVNVSNKLAPVQMGAFLNTSIHSVDNIYPFYNKAWRIGNYAWIPVDYAGLEVEDVSNPASITTVSYSNLWNNANGISSWYGSDGHANEIVYASPTADVLMVSGADSQILAFDPTTPSQPRIMGWWGPPNTDNQAAWGCDVFGNLAVCGYIRDVFSNQPYYSTYGGIQLLSWNLVTSTNETAQAPEPLQVFPNPATDLVTVALPVTLDETYTIDVLDVTGRVVKTQTADPKANGRNAVVDLSGLSAGVYWIRVSGQQVVCTAQIVRQ